jgi:hypothetical protein
MSARERLAAERTIRRARYAYTLVAGVLGILAAIIADQEEALASSEASRAQGDATRRRGYAAMAATQGERGTG